MSWFNVDKAGLAAILERRGKTFALFELISNAWDSGARSVAITLSPIPNEPYCVLRVLDDGNGFEDLLDAHTMFARSRRAGDAGKRGRFNLGEKLVLACCRRASIKSKGYQVLFEPDSKPKISKNDEPIKFGTVTGSEIGGTSFRGEIRMTRQEYAEACNAMFKLIPPVMTQFNSEKISEPEPFVVVKAKLPTEFMDDDGQLRRTVRECEVEIYDASADGSGDILELGIPVVETDNGFRVNVLQKVPLNMERDNVTPAFLKAINVLVLNATASFLDSEKSSAPWAQEAVGDARATPEAVKAVVTSRFGDRAVVATPGDVLANAQAEANGYTVIPGGAMSAGAWANIRKHDVLLPSARVFPSPKPAEIAAKRDMAPTGVCPQCGKPL